MNDLFSFPVQLKGVQEKWARDPQLQPLSLSVGKLVEKLAPLLHRSIFYLELSDPKYLRGNSRGGGVGISFLQEHSSWACSSQCKGWSGTTCNQLGPVGEAHHRLTLRNVWASLTGLR